MMVARNDDRNITPSGIHTMTYSFTLGNSNNMGMAGIEFEFSRNKQGVPKNYKIKTTSVPQSTSLYNLNMLQG